MKSPKLGKSTSEVEVQDVRKDGIWLYACGQEYFLDYKGYPWFRDATISEIYDVEFHHGHALRWPRLDVDLELESLEHPEKYPLRYKP